MKKTLIAAFAAAAGCVASASAGNDVVYVDRDAAPGGDGKTLETAYDKIADALENVDAGGTVLVAPGVYDSDEMVDSDGYTNRVYITKRVNLKSIGGKHVTHIVGKWASRSLSDAYPGIGSDAIRCIRMGPSAYYSVIEGFTISGGASHTLDDNFTGYGGGVVGNNKSFFVVDCVISNCVANRGGALRNVTAVRTWITRNRGGSCAGRSVNLVNCLVTANLDNNILMGSFLVNCTVAGNANVFSGTTAGYTLYNTILVNNAGIAGSTTPITADGCVFNSVSAYGCLANANTSLGNSKTRSGGCDYHFMAPLVNDWRLIPSSVAVGLGNHEHLSNATLPVIDGVDVDYYKDYNGEKIERTGAINPGCIQSLSEEPASGAVHFVGPCIVNGKMSGGLNLYAFASEYPAQFNVKPVLAPGERPYRVEREPASTYDQIPQLDDSLWVVTPPAGQVTTNDFLLTTNVLYVSNAGDDDNDGRSVGSAMSTLQAAIDASGDGPAVIVAAEGTYDRGGVVRNGVSNRVYIAGDKIVRLVGAGRGKSVIKGAADPDGPAGDGRGPDACRCVCIGSVGSVVQGFTLTDGYSGYADGTEDPSTGDTRGGAFTADVTGSSKSIRVYLADCDITSCGATRGGVAYCGTLVRCRISDSYSVGGCIRYARLFSCLLTDNTPLGNAALYGGGCQAYNCTFYVPYSDEELGSYALNGITNCVAKLSSGTFGVKADSLGVNLIDGEPLYSTTAPVVLGNGGFVGDSLLKNPEDSDFRPLSCSPAVALGEVFDGYHEHYTSDVDGNPVLFSDGRPACGAFQTTVRAVIVERARYGEFTSPASITNGVDSGESLTVKLEDSTRPCIGFTVNGVTNVTDDLTYTFSEGGSGAIDEAIVIEPVYTTHWYVDEVNGNDAWNGFSPGTARKTLKGIMDWGVRIYGGDTIHVAEGLYDDEVMDYGEGEVRARVVVPDGVTLLADGARENTIIEGASAETDADVLGNGSGAVRCVAMSTYRSVIKGFTLRGGRTLSGNYTTADYVGGGVFTDTTTGSVGARVIDCIITNCCANRGGGGYNRIDYVNCIFVDNRAMTASSAMAGGAAFNCVFTRNRGQTCVQASWDIVNCTLFDNYTNYVDYADMTPARDISIPSGGAAVYNTVAKGSVYGNSSIHLFASNCVFASVEGKYSLDDKTIIVDASTLQFSPWGTPLSAENPVVDRADCGLIDRFVRMDYEKDVTGGQRIYNGRLDVGAAEFDWRPEYARALGAGYASVPDASPDVVASDDDSHVVIGSGLLSLHLSGNSGARRIRYAIPVEVKGDGTLSVKLNGEPLASLTSADGAQILEFRNTFAENDLEFSYDGSDEGVKLASLTRDAPNFVITFR